jgi:hypothetical protein
VLLVLLLWPLAALAIPPVLSSTPHYQSPVVAEPDALLLLPGATLAATDVVVYQALSNTTATLTPPLTTPTTRTATTGTAPIASTARVPDALVVYLPPVLTPGQSYALWVRNTMGEWSNGVKVNDARPLWLTPELGYATALSPGLPTRYLKVVGRNLAPAPGQTTQVRLVGPATYTMTASNDGDTTTVIEDYAATVTLPGTMTVGTYTVAVNRDGVSWVSVAGQSFTVSANPATPPTFSPTSYGGCVAGDAGDDVVCMQAAANAAAAAGGGTVLLGAGTWRMNDGTVGGSSDPTYGAWLPIGVNLQGAGAGSTTIARGAGWNPNLAGGGWSTSFTLLGNNIVSGITFTDEATYAPTQTGLQRILRVGDTFDVTTTVDRVTITANVFTKPYIALDIGNHRLNHLTVTANTFGAYFAALRMLGSVGTYGDGGKFVNHHLILTGNTFYPGSYLNVAGAQGTVAGFLSSTRRADVSQNTIDGTATTYLQVPGSDAKGWRAGLFWTNHSSIEMNLVARNTFTCTGDKAGDGEAIAYDGTDNPTFAHAQPVLTATATTVKVPGPLPATDVHGTALDPAYFSGDLWLLVVDGPGVGQMRRSVGAVTDGSGTVFTVSPAWDVTPTTASKLTMANAYWQVYTIDNMIDSRTPLCLKSNRNVPQAGLITLYGGPQADSVVAGNRQYDSDGIYLNLRYFATDPAAPGYNPDIRTHYFVEVRQNVIAQEYDAANAASQSGIRLNLSAAPTPTYPPPVLGYGITLAHNTINHADSLYGAIGPFSGFGSSVCGPDPDNWPVIQHLLLDHNTLTDLVGGTGIGLPLACLWHTILLQNTVTNVTTPLSDSATATVLYSPPALAVTTGYFPVFQP